MLPLAEFPILDRNAVHHGVPMSSLMEKAGTAVAEVVRSHCKPETRILIICGPGNNGGDGFVAARHLEGACELSVTLLNDEKGIRNRLCRRNMELVHHLVHDWDEVDLQDYDLVVDAMLGTGVKGRPREPFASAMESLLGYAGKLVSIDVPSGWGTELSLRPSVTVTFHAQKEGMSESWCGLIHVADIGIPAAAEASTGPGEYQLYPVPSHSAHKGMGGKLLIIGGGPYTGAPSLAGMGACHVGVDLLHIATPEPSFLPVASHSPLFMAHQLDGDVLSAEHLPRLKDLASGVDALLIGPGIGKAPKTLQAVTEIVGACGKPVVLDADALRADIASLPVACLQRMVLTPHRREFERLWGESIPTDRQGIALAVGSLAERLGCTVLLTGDVDIISDGERIKFNYSGNAAMAHGGSGDVLSGAVAGLLSKGLLPFDAARLGALLCGEAGDLAFRAKSYGMTAVDIYDSLPLALREGLRRRHG